MQVGDFGLFPFVNLQYLLECSVNVLEWTGSPGGGRVLPYKGLMGTRGEQGYVFRDFCLKQGIEFIIFCLYQGIDLSIFVLNRKNVLNRVSKIGILS